MENIYICLILLWWAFDQCEIVTDAVQRFQEKGASTTDQPWQGEYEETLRLKLKHTFHSWWWQCGRRASPPRPWSGWWGWWCDQACTWSASPRWLVGSKGPLLQSAHPAQPPCATKLKTVQWEMRVVTNLDPPTKAQAMLSFLCIPPERFWLCSCLLCGIPWRKYVIFKWIGKHLVCVCPKCSF